MAHRASVLGSPSRLSSAQSTHGQPAPVLFRSPWAASPQQAPPRARRLVVEATLVHQATATSPLDLAPSSVSTQSSSLQAAHLQEPEPLLSYEIVKGALVRYSDAASSTKVPTAVLVHGILGKRQNMIPFARRLVAGFPHWQIVVVDLRCHGESAALSSSLRGAHGLESAANDVISLLSSLKLFPEMLIGHSFGGKVVLQMTQAWSKSKRRLPRPVQVWVLDALPGEVRSADMGGNDRPADLISTLQQVPLPVPSRHWLIAHLEAAGFSRQVSAWAATNLAARQPAAGGGLGWGFDLSGIAQMFRSYETSDLWALLASPAEGVRLSFVKAERSTFRWGGSDEARIRSLGHGVHLLPASGHWVHTDNPDGLFDILAPTFGAAPDLRMQRSPQQAAQPSAATAAAVNASPSSPNSSNGGSSPAANNIAPGALRQLQGLMM